MAEIIMTRSSVLAEAMQFEGTQRNFDEIMEWVQNYNMTTVVVWNGNDAMFSGDIKVAAEPGLLEVFPGPGYTPMEAVPGDWIVKTGRDTFYTVAKETFEEIWEVAH